MIRLAWKTFRLVISVPFNLLTAIFFAISYWIYPEWMASVVYEVLATIYPNSAVKVENPKGES
jgi:hypothetical protein